MEVLKLKKFAAEGEVSMEHFEVASEAIPELQEGQFLMRNLYISCDPTHRIFATGKESYVPAAKIGSKIIAAALGEVEQSKNPDFPKGICVMAWTSWETYSVVTPPAVILKIDPSTNVALETYMAVINVIIGLTAWVGTNTILNVNAGDTVCVSGAAGAVGSMVCQLAKEKGAKVVGIAGSKDKCDFLTSIGCAAAVNYKTESVKLKLSEVCPEGFSCYFDNVGGDITEAALSNMKQEGRVAICGMISQYEQEIGKDVGRIRCWDTILFKRLTVKGYICSDHGADAPKAFAELEELLQKGVLRFNKHVFTGGLPKCVEALQSLTRGTNVGKTMVKLGDPSNPAYKTA